MRFRSALARSARAIAAAVVILAIACTASAQSAANNQPSVAVRLMTPGSRTPVSTMLGAPPRAHANVRADGAPAPQVDPPKFSLAPGVYSSAQSVSITCDTPGATIYYTTDGTYPETNSATYSGAIAISRSSTLVAVARASGDTDSFATYANYYISSVKDSFIYNIAGNKFWGFSGDGGLATQAEVNSPAGVALDKSGNLFVADSVNNVIRKIDASSGIITTVAGTGVAGKSGENGPAVSAQLSNPTGLAFDSTGNLYIADNYNGVIRKIDMSSGAISTIAGDPSSSVLGDGGPATSALLIGPHAIAFDSSDNLYIAEAGGGRVREVDAKTQIITTVVGGGNLPYGQYGDGGPATSATLSGPESLALDSVGNIYIADTFDSAIRKVTRSTGIINTVVGIIGQNSQFSGDGGPATSAHINLPQSITLDSFGNLYISDTDNYRIRKVTATTGVISTIAGNGSSCSSFGEDGSPAALAGVCEPYGLAFDNNGNLYFSDWGTTSVKMITPAAAPGTPTAAPVFSVPAGAYATPQTLTLSDPTPGASIYLQVNTPLNPNSPTVPTETTGYNGPIPIDGNVTISASAAAPGHIPSDTVTVSYTITQPPNSIISTVAGNGTAGISGAGGPATSAEIANPFGIAFDSGGSLYITDCVGVIWKVDSASGIISIVAGLGATGPAGKVSFSCPHAVAVDKSGNVFIADTFNNVVREVQPATGNIAVYAGGGIGQGIGDGGPANQARLDSPTSLAFDSKGNLYIAEYNAVREVDSATNIITTVAGNGTSGSGGTIGDGVPATSAKVNPRAITFDGSDNMFIADLYFGCIRRIDAKTEIITTVGGDGDDGESGNGLSALDAEVEPYSIAVDAKENIYFGTTRQVRKIDASTGVISAAVGIGYSGSSGDGGSPLAATMCEGYGLAFDAAGNLYLSDICGPSVRKVTFNVSAPAPTFNPPAGAYGGQQSVTISDTAPNATIYYTTDGSTPTTKSTTYSGPIDVPIGKETINAIAVAAGYAQSPVGSAAYTIQIVPAIALASSQNPSVVSQSVTFTATLSSPAGTPTGSVVFYDGTTSLGSGTLASGVATYATTALAAGAHSITAQYSGDANFAPVTSSALTQTVNTFGIGPAAGAPTTASGAPGSIATYVLSVTPPAANAVTFSVTGLPAGFSSAFSPNTVAAGTGTTQVELTINIPSQAASNAVPAKPGSASRLPLAFGLVLLPLLGLGRRIRGSRFLLLAVLAIAGVIASTALSGCSHNFNSGTTGNPPPPGTYTLTVTATAGAQTQSTALTLNVQ